MGGEDGQGTAPLRLETLGGLRIWQADERVDGQIPAKAALMIAYLADTAAPARRSTIAGLLWSDFPEEQARSSLRVTLSRLRTVLPDCVNADRSSISLAVPAEVDTAVSTLDDPGAVLHAYRGDFLHGVDLDGAELYRDWASARRQALQTTAVRQLRSGIDDSTAQDRWTDVRAFCDRLLDIEPWNEVAHRGVMASLWAEEGRVAALTAFERCVTLLADDFGVEPEEQTANLAATIRTESPPTPTGSDAPPRSSTGRSSTSTVLWRLLGDVSVIVDGVIHDVGGQHRRSLIACLALHAPRRVELSELERAIWGDDPPPTARQSIRRFVREIRNIGPIGDQLETVPNGYRLTVLPHEVDALQVKVTVDQARAAFAAGDVAFAVQHFEEAATTWSGRSLGGVSMEGSLRGARAALDEIYLGIIEDLIEGELALGRHREVSDRAESFASDHPERERAWGHLMLARYRCGRQAEAVEAYELLHQYLVEHQQLEPSPSIRALYSQILEHAPALEAPQARSESTTAATTTTATTSLAVPLPAPLDRPDALPLVGRDEQLSHLRRCFTDVSTSGPATVLYAGEPGIGKTRLAAEFARALHRTGAIALYGRSDEGRSAAYQPWREAFAHLADHVPPHIARRHVDRFGESLRMLMPTLDVHRDPPSAPGSAANDEHQQDVLFRSSVGLLDDVARRRPVVLVLDDLQWADESSLRLLRHFALRATSPILILGLYRTTEVDSDHPVTDLVGKLEGAGAGQLFLLDGLDAAAGTELVQRLLPGNVAEQASEMAAAIGTETNGNPFFFTEILRSIIETSSSVLADGQLDAETLPPSVQRVVMQRVRRLGDGVAEVIRTAAVFGREFDLAVLAHALDRSEDAVLDELEIALASGLLTDAPTGRDRFAFCHDLVHHTLLGEFSVSRLRRIHGRIAVAMEHVHGDALGEQIGSIATHLLAADEPSMADRTILRCRQAGQQSAARYAPAEAITWFQRAIDVLESTSPRDAARRSELLVELGTQQRNAGNPAHRATLIEAGQLALELGHVDTLVASVLANSRGMNSHVWEFDVERIDLLRAALEKLGPVESTARAELLASLANEQWDEAYREDAEALYAEAMALARRLGDPDTLARVLVRVSRARNFRFERDEFMAVSAEVGRLAQRPEITDPLLVANCLTTVVNTSLRLGLADELAAANEQVWQAARDYQLPMFVHAGHLCRGLAEGVAGDIASYEAEATATYDYGVEIGDEEAIFILEGHMYYTSMLRGELGNLVEFSIKVMNDRPDVPLYRAVSTLMHVEAGKDETARDMLDAEVEAGIEPSVDMFQIQGLTTLANAAASVEHHAACARLYDVLARHSGETSGHLVQVGEPIDICLGRMCAVLERFEDAEHHFDIAQGIADSFAARWMQAQTTVSRAKMLIDRDRDGDRERGTSIAAEVLTVAQREGYDGVARLAADLLAVGHAAPPPTAAT